MMSDIEVICELLLILLLATIIISRRIFKEWVGKDKLLLERQTTNVEQRFDWAIDEYDDYYHRHRHFNIMLILIMCISVHAYARLYIHTCSSTCGMLSERVPFELLFYIAVESTRWDAYHTQHIFHSIHLIFYMDIISTHIYIFIWSNSKLSTII